MNIGDTVKHSESVIRKHFEYYLNIGRQPAKSKALDFHNAQKQERGTVSAILQPPKGVSYHGTEPYGYEIAWNNGMVSRSLSYRIEKA